MKFTALSRKALEAALAVSSAPLALVEAPAVAGTGPRTVTRGDDPAPASEAPRSSRTGTRHDSRLKTGRRLRRDP